MSSGESAAVRAGLAPGEAGSQGGATAGAIDPSIRPAVIGAFPPQLPLAFGGSWYGPYSAPGGHDAAFTAAMQAAYEAGIRHFDTAGGYGNGHSEELMGAFLKGRRDTVFLASKANPADASAASMTEAIDASLRRLDTDHIDLFYIHWPRQGMDMRPRMEALEAARRAGKIRAAGVSNFSVAEMREVQQIGRIDAHQLGYNLLWRYPEAELIPFCVAEGIAVVAYSTLAHGILTGKFGPVPALAPGDQRHSVLPFRADIWPHVHAGVEEMKAIAAGLGRPLMHLAIRWSLARPGIASVVVGARDRAQLEANVAALGGDIPESVLARLTAISDEIIRHVPDEGNLFDYHP